ncbi:hypothetical protein M885DRAFT_272891 [Pelagophyceae sp. CCMP2097]|nr:hypothetical protein M885DRAFT_272891 [Pelagophyceae sp. CCMP2097]
MNPASTPRQAGAEPSDVIYPMPPALARNLSNKSLCHLADEGSASPAIPAYRPNSRFVARAGSDHFEAGPHRVENCVICLERLRANGDDATTVPCGCQLRLETPSKMHVQCLRAWVNACAKRASNDIGLERAPTCPLCRAQFTDDAVFNLMIAPRPRLCLQMRPCEFALEALQPADGALRCVVRVLDRAQRRRWANLASSDAAPLLALNVEGLCGPNAAPGHVAPRHAL